MRSEPTLLIETANYRLAYEVFNDKVYLHSDIKSWSKGIFIELFGHVQDLGKKCGLLYTYATDEKVKKLCKQFQFVPTGELVPFWFGEETKLPEYVLMNDLWQFCVDIGKRFHDLNLFSDNHEDDLVHNWAVGRAIVETKLDLDKSIKNYNEWAIANDYHQIDNYTKDDITMQDKKIQIKELQCLL